MKYKKILLILFVMVLVSFFASMFYKNLKDGESGKDSAFDTSAQALVTVDFEKNLGDMPEIFDSGIWIAKEYSKNNDYILKKFLKENTMGAVQTLLLDISESSDIEDYKKKLKETYDNELFRKFGTEGTQVVGTFFSGGMMPEWLSSMADAKDETGWHLDVINSDNDYRSVVKSAPPTCYEWECVRKTDGKTIPGWERVAYETVKFFHSIGIKNFSIALGHEPNRDWLASEEDFYKLYLHTAKGALKFSDKVKLGGVGSWHWQAKKLNCDAKGKKNAEYVYSSHVRESDYCKAGETWSLEKSGQENYMTKNFIEYSGKNNLPLDFLNFHAFGVAPGEFKNVVGPTIDGLLRQNGYNSTKIYPGDWTRWVENYPMDFLDNEDSASYVISALYNMNLGGIDFHTHDFDVNDPGFEKSIISSRGKDAQFLGDWPIFTHNQVIKPIYNSFKALSILTGKNDEIKTEQVKSEIQNNDGDFISAISSATKDKTKVRIVLSNFPPSGELMSQYITSKFSESLSVQSIKQYKDKLNLCVDVARISSDCVNDILVTINDPIIKERLKTQAELINCLNFSNEKFQCVQVSYSKAEDKQTKEDLNLIKNEYQKMLKYQKVSKKVLLKTQNIPFGGKATITTYSIDKDHSNSCGYNKKTEPSQTNTECGINGAVDRAVSEAKKEAQEKALSETFRYLEEKGYENDQIAIFKSQIVNQCSGSEKPLACVHEQIDSFCQKYPNFNCVKIKKDLADAYAKYQEVYSTLFYYGKYKNIEIAVWIDKINNDPNISLEGSKQFGEININNGSYEEEIFLEPYSVKLIEIKR